MVKKRYPGMFSPQSKVMTLTGVPDFDSRSLGRVIRWPHMPLQLLAPVFTNTPKELVGCWAIWPKCYLVVLR